MEPIKLDETLRVVEASLFQNRWRLKTSSKSRLQIDVLALLTRMRPCIMVDYGGKMPELGDRLCAFIDHSIKESSTFELLRVMVIDDMVYLINVKAFADFVKSSLSVESPVHFVDLEHDPPKVVTMSEKNPAFMQLLSAQKLFSSVFHVHEISDHGTYTGVSSTDEQAMSESPVLVDVSSRFKECQVTIPTLNGWLLGYPVIYLFGKDYIERAVYNLSTKSLHIYQIFVERVSTSGKGPRKEELLSFSVPYDLSLEGSEEEWAKVFLARILEKLEKCKNVWGRLSMEVIGCYPQAIAL